MTGRRPTKTTRTKRRSAMASHKSSIRSWVRHQKPVPLRLPSHKEQTKVISEPSPVVVEAQPYQHHAALDFIRSHMSQSHKRSASSRRESLEMDRPAKRSRLSSQPFRFLEMPAEIRFMIYGYSLTESEPLYLDTLGAPPPLTRVCRQIRQEALPVFLGCNSFTTLFSSIPATPCSLTTTYSTSFTPATQSWLSTLPAEQPLIRDLSFALQPSTWDINTDLSSDYRLKQGKLTHGHECPFCSNGNYGNVAPVSLSHPALPESMKQLLVQAQQTHDVQLDAINNAMRTPKALSLYNIIDLVKAFVGPAENITKLVGNQQRIVEDVSDKLSDWKTASRDEKRDIERTLGCDAAHYFADKESYIGAL